MTLLRRPSAASRILDLTRELAEEYDSVPLPAVSETVRRAAGVIDLSDRDAAVSVAVVERRARHELSDQQRSRRAS